MTGVVVTMESEPRIRLRPSVDPINTSTDEPRTHIISPVTADTPVFREPAWSPGVATSPKSTGPVLLQPAMDEAGMAQRDKALLTRLDAGSISSSDSSTRSRLSSPDGSGKKLPDAARRSSQTPSLGDAEQAQRPAPPQHVRSKLPPAPIRTAAHGPRLPSLVRLAGGDDKTDRRRLSRTLALQSPATPRSPAAYGAFTPVHMVPMPLNYGWNSMAMPYAVGQFPASAHPFAQAQAQAMAQARASAQAPPLAQGRTQAGRDEQAPTSSPTPVLREDLWKVGSRYMCSPETADAFVKAVQIRHGSTPTRRTSSPATGSAAPSAHSDDMALDGLDEPGTLPNPFGDTLRLHVTIHSPDRASKSIFKAFERHKLRQSLPDFARSPQTPRANSVASASGLGAGAVPSRAAAALARRRKSQFRSSGQPSAPATPATPDSAGASRLSMPPVPIHRPFARAHVPALNAVLLQQDLKRGDTIDLPMPFPGSWLETVAYMYTGHEACLSERVRQNLWYLGGLPG